jgi:hypothetical protein
MIKDGKLDLPLTPENPITTEEVLRTVAYIKGAEAEIKDLLGRDELIGKSGERLLAALNTVLNLLKGLTEKIKDFEENNKTWLNAFNDENLKDEYENSYYSGYDITDATLSVLQKRFMDLPWENESLEKLQTIIDTARIAFKREREENPEEYAEFDFTLIELEVLISDQPELVSSK